MKVSLLKGDYQSLNWFPINLTASVIYDWSPGDVQKRQTVTDTDSGVTGNTTYVASKLTRQ